MAKNKYPDSLGLDDCIGFSDVTDKLKMFYEMEYVYFYDLIREILLHKYGLKKSGDNCDDDLQLLKHLLIEYVPGTPKSIIFNMEKYDKDLELRNKITNRRASLIAMFKLYELEGKSQNQTANILSNKGMSKGLKVRYHEALQDLEAVEISDILQLKQMNINFKNYFDSKAEVGNRINLNVDFLIEHYNKHI